MHLVWAVHWSIRQPGRGGHALIFDAIALKNPAAHVLHMGWEVTVPPTEVYWPAGHFLWAMHFATEQPSVLQMVLLDVAIWKNPVAHDTHARLEVVEPVALVNFPGGHLVFWSMQESVMVLLFDVMAL